MVVPFLHYAWQWVCWLFEVWCEECWWRRADKSWSYRQHLLFLITIALSVSHHAMPVKSFKVGHWATLSYLQLCTSLSFTKKLVTLGMSEDISEMQTQYKGWWSCEVALALLHYCSKWSGHCHILQTTNRDVLILLCLSFLLWLFAGSWPKIGRPRILLYNISEDKHQDIPNKFLPKIPWLAATVILIEECFETLHSTISLFPMHKIRRDVVVSLCEGEAC